MTIAVVGSPGWCLLRHTVHWTTQAGLACGMRFSKTVLATGRLEDNFVAYGQLCAKCARIRPATP